MIKVNRPLNSDNPCPKCGNAYGHTIKWVPAKTQIISQRPPDAGIHDPYSDYTEGEKIIDPERMEITCMCGYSWEQPPLDAAKS